MGLFWEVIIRSDQFKSAGTGASCQQCEYRKRRSSGARNRRK